MGNTRKEELQAVIDAYDSCDSQVEAARLLGINYSTYKDRLRAAREASMTPKCSFTNAKTTVNESPNHIIVEDKSGRITSLPEAYEYAEIDPDVWVAERVIVNGWDVTMKMGQEGSYFPQTVQNKQVKVVFRRVVPERIVAAAEYIGNRVLEQAPKKWKSKTFKPPKDAHALEISIFDHHFGKLAWEPETGDNEDLHISEDNFAKATDDLLQQASHYPIEKIVFPLGQDLFHIDRILENVTTHGTQMDVDSRFAKIFETGFIAVSQAIEHMLRVAPVEIKWVPGNHDYQTSYCLVHSLKSMFSSNKNVIVDLSPKPRKCMEYGVNLIGFAHGKDEKARDLPLNMAVEWPNKWAKTKWREWHIGHWHRKGETRTMPLDTHGGVPVRIIPSLCGVDLWHYQKGFVGNVRMAEAYLYSKTRGPRAQFTTTIF